MAKTRSFEQVQTLVRAALNEGRAGDNSFYICECYSNKVIFTSYSESDRYQQSFSIDDSDVVTLGADRVKVVREVKYVPVKAKFSVDAEFKSKDTVRYVGKVFELGSFEDKNFALNEAEADSAISAFSPVDVDSEHQSSVFDGKLGKVQKLWRKGTEIWGEYFAPKPLFDLVGSEVTVSASWSYDPKRFIKMALVADPRISDAKLTAAFAMGGAGSRNEEIVMDAQFDQEETGFLKKMFQFFKGGGTPAIVTTAPVTTFNDPVKDAEIVTLKAQVVAQHETSLKATAVAFANEQVQAGKATPAEREGIAAAYASLARADAALAKVAMFSNDGALHEGEGLKGFKAMFEAKAKGKVIPDGSTFRVEQGGTEQEVNFSASDIYAKRAEAVKAQGGAN